MWRDENLKNIDTCWLLSSSAHSQCPQVCTVILRFFPFWSAFPALICYLSSLNLLQEPGCERIVTCAAHHHRDSASSGFWNKQQSYKLCFMCPFRKPKTYESLAKNIINAGMVLSHSHREYSHSLSLSLFENGHQHQWKTNGIREAPANASTSFGEDEIEKNGQTVGIRLAVFVMFDTIIL